MERDLSETIALVRSSLHAFVPELILSLGILLVLLAGLLNRRRGRLTLMVFGTIVLSLVTLPHHAAPFGHTLFGGMVRSDNFSAYLRALIDVGGVLTLVMAWRDTRTTERLSEYYSLLLAVILGAHLLVMSQNLLMVFLSLEIMSLCSYVLAGFSFTRQGAEGSLKYFLFGAVASAVMLYGLSLLYGFTGTLDFSSGTFSAALQQQQTPLVFVAGLMVLAGFLYKLAAAPAHPWAPDVYEGAPMPVVAFFSVVPKLAAIGALLKFVLVLNAFGQSTFDWQAVLAVVAIITLTVGNFSALWQKNPKRLMAYSSIAQSGFLLVGVVAFLPQGMQFMLFYATVYVVMNFLVFIYLQGFENIGLETIASYQGLGRQRVWPMVFLLVGLVALTGLPPTAGFTGKLFIFSALWEAYALSGKPVLLWLLVIGLLNTVVSLFYYLRIPYFAFIKNGESPTSTNNLTFENLFGLLLVLLLLVLFFSPGLLMGWINKITFVIR
ncbi:NADH-quinone oxidoreductase subunit N [Dawidia soli]|uniref:NADH-quinone oxidoreductase subunit N n=1 Tax=Dawidia soli TaxID=2782352 RepID=A0AAP2GJ86_9BACT|nr:NADH-quinone oxidoreductase subunit N [Dawidia soli]MBT1687728.1 NADH-quinone oxidoreductase subunit N [Dawidia soli]